MYLQTHCGLHVLTYVLVICQVCEKYPISSNKCRSVYIKQCHQSIGGWRLVLSLIFHGIANARLNSNGPMHDL